MASTPRVWLKSALLERELNDPHASLSLLDEAMQRYPSFPKFYVMAAQICADQGGPGVSDHGRAREYLQRGLKQCPDNPMLWVLSIRLEEQLRGVTKARSMAEMARLRLPTSELVWLESIRMERRSGHEKLAESVTVKALQQCPTAGILWAEEVLHCPRTAQKQKYVSSHICLSLSLFICHVYYLYFCFICTCTPHKTEEIAIFVTVPPFFCTSSFFSNPRGAAPRFEIDSNECEKREGDK
jgi:hypothetical protein